MQLLYYMVLFIICEKHIYVHYYHMWDHMMILMNVTVLKNRIIQQVLNPYLCTVVWTNHSINIFEFKGRVESESDDLNLGNCW